MPFKIDINDRLATSLERDNDSVEQYNNMYFQIPDFPMLYDYSVDDRGLVNNTALFGSSEPEGDIYWLAGFFVLIYIFSFCILLKLSRCCKTVFDAYKKA